MKRKLGFLLTMLLMICMIASVLAACTGIEPKPGPVTDDPDKTYSVGYTRGDNAVEGKAPTGQRYKAGETFTVAYPDDLVFVGYYFVCWNDGEKNVEAGSTYTMPAKSVTFVAQWAEEDDDMLSLIFDANGATGTAPTTRHILEEDKITIPDQAGLTREGYTFLGWTDGSNYFTPGETYDASELINLRAKDLGYVNLRARWHRTANNDIEGHWLNGVAVSGPVHTHISGMEGREVYTEQYVSIKYNRSEDGTVNRNGFVLVLFTKSINADGKGTFTTIKNGDHDVVEFEKTAENTYLEKTGGAYAPRAKVVVLDNNRLQVTTHLSAEEPSVFEYDEQRDLGAAPELQKGDYYCASVETTYTYSGLGETGNHIGTCKIVGYDGSVGTSFVQYEFVGEYIIAYSFDPQTVAYLGYEVFWINDNGLLVTYYGGSIYTVVFEYMGVSD